MDSRKLTVLGLAVVAVMATAALAVALGPKPITTATDKTGEPELTQLLDRHAPRATRNIAAFTHRDGSTTFAGLGADEHTEFEIGSITKTFTAELLNNAIQRGDLTLNTTVGEIIAIPGAAAENITMEELATHTSGLPRLSRMGLGTFISSFTGGNPYEGYTNEELFEHTREASVSDRGEFSYSNFGFALLGQLIAKASDSTYPELLKEEILAPLNMENTYLMLPGTVSDDAPRGLTSRGRESQAWEMDADAPAGAIRSTAHDMAIYAEYILSKPLPDYTWIHNEEKDFFFHNGGTGGFRSMLIIDPDSGTATFTINDTTAAVDELGAALMDDLQRGGMS